MRLGLSSGYSVGSKLLWGSAAAYSSTVLAGHRILENQTFSWLVAAIGLISLCCSLLQQPPLSRALIASQAVVALASVLAVIIHVVTLVGFEVKFLETLGGFAQGSLLSADTYKLFIAYALIRLILLLGLLALIVRFLKKPLRVEGYLAFLYAFSAINIVCEYSFWRPLYRVGADPDELAFLFSAGIFGMEFSLPFYLAALIAVLAANSRRKTAPPSRKT